MLAALALLVLTATVESPSPAQDESGPARPAAQGPKADWVAVPVLSFSQDDGLGYGAAANYQWIGHGRPYAHQFTGQVFFTSGGLQNHLVDYDGPRFLGTSLRIWAHAEWRSETAAPYYGPGNQSSRVPADHPGLGERPFSYDVRMPMARLGAALPVAGELSVFCFLQGRSVSVQAPSGSLLERERPRGIDGGGGLGAEAGLFFDVRDSEVNPSRGVYVELAARGESSERLAPWTALSLVEKHFIPIGSRLTLGSRLQVDWVSAGAPFWERAAFGGVEHFDGVGGQYSLRGIPKNRYTGRLKALESVEMRAQLFSVDFLDGEAVHVGAVGFVDVGRVWMLDGSDGDPWDVHAGYGGGVRLSRRAFVARMDVATSVERPFSAYAVFGHFF